MKLRFEDVAAYGEITDLPAETLSPEAEARITAMTMKQIAPKRRKPLRYIAAAAAVIAALGITTFAAAERLFKIEDALPAVIEADRPTALPAAACTNPRGPPKDPLFFCSIIVLLFLNIKTST